jgi:hypothetical protein
MAVVGPALGSLKSEAQLEVSMIRGQAFWVCVFIFCAVFIVVVGTLWRAHAILGSDLVHALALEAILVVTIAAACVRVPSRLGALRGQIAEKSLARISLNVYSIVMFAYLGLMILAGLLPHR